METKTDFLQKMDTQMAEFNLKLDSLMAKSGHVDADAKPGYDDRVKELQEQRQTIEKKVNEMKDCDPQGWEEQKISIESSAAKLDQSFREALAYFK